MDVNQKLTDFQRVELTRQSYKDLKIGQIIKIDDIFIGRISKKIYAMDGMRAFVIRNRINHEYTIIFRGSSGLTKGNPRTWKDEWFDTNMPIFFGLCSLHPKIPSQLNTATIFLNGILKEHPTAHFYVYGHSLGAINAEYALVNCPHPQRIVRAYLYEGTNIWLLLTRKQRRRAKAIRHKVFSYVDIHDPVTLGITASHRMIGKLQYVDSKKLKPITQHMWGGYHFDKNGKLFLKDVDSAFLQDAKSERKFIRKISNLVEYLNRIGQKEAAKKLSRRKNRKLFKMHRRKRKEFK